MKPMIEIKFDEVKLRKIQRMLRDIPRAMPRVMSRSINRTASSTKTDIARRIAGEINIKISAVKKGITVKRASYRVWQAVIGIWTKRIPLINFVEGISKGRKIRTAKTTGKLDKRFKKVGPGVTYRISKTQGRKTIKDAFIATMKSGHTGVFKRRGTARLPIVELKGPSLGSVFKGSAGIAMQSRRQAYQKLYRNVNDQVRLALMQWKKASSRAA